MALISEGVEQQGQTEIGGRRNLSTATALYYCSLMVTVSIFISTAHPTWIHNGTHLISSITGLVARVEGNDRGDIERTLATENALMSVEGI